MALAVGGVVIGIYGRVLPNHADMRSAPSGDPDLDSAERSAAWTSAAIVSGISLLAKDPTIFTVGAGMIVAMSWLARHSNYTNPLTGFASNVIPMQSVPDPSAADADAM